MNEKIPFEAFLMVFLRYSILGRVGLKNYGGFI